MEKTAVLYLINHNYTKNSAVLLLLQYEHKDAHSTNTMMIRMQMVLDYSVLTYTAVCHGPYHKHHGFVVWDKCLYVDHFICCERRGELRTAGRQVVQDRVLDHLNK